jgi:uncharacterized heparinase superfamily protein
MSALLRYAAAIRHLGPRQAALNLLHRTRALTRRLERYRRPARGLEWCGRVRTRPLAHSGGARLERGRFEAIGRSGTVGDPPDWDLDAPLLWLFNLHYFGWLDASPAPEQRRLVNDWIARYPPAGRRAGWLPYPLSLRLRHWWRALLEGGALCGDRAGVLPSVETQADCLADTLEHHLRGNHLLESAITLKLLSGSLRGAAVPRWVRLADRVLDAELAEQFLLDGGHFERSAMYHALLLHGLLDLVNLLPDDDEVRVRLAERVPSLLHFLSGMTHPDGEIALFNDAAFGIAPSPAALFEYAGRLGFAQPAAASASFPETGYHAFRQGGDLLVVDAGPIGPDYLSTHAHGDIFSFELSLGGRRVAVDAGTSTYAEGPERDWVRSTRSHNTVEIDGADQCEFFGAFRVGRRGRPQGVLARASTDALHMSGWHDGYRRLRGRPIHRRELLYLREGALLVWDTIESSAEVQADSRVRFAPGAKIALEAADEASIEAGGERLILHAFGGVLELEPDYYAKQFGQREPCMVLVLRKGKDAAFGFALARAGLQARIDSGGAEVAGRRVLREGRSGLGARY